MAAFRPEPLPRRVLVGAVVGGLVAPAVNMLLVNPYLWALPGISREGFVLASVSCAFAILGGLPVLGAFAASPRSVSLRFPLSLAMRAIAGALLSGAPALVLVYLVPSIPHELRLVFLMPGTALGAAWAWRSWRRRVEWRQATYETKRMP